jgi:hypothetical protein
MFTLDEYRCARLSSKSSSSSSAFGFGGNVEGAFGASGNEPRDTYHVVSVGNDAYL